MTPEQRFWAKVDRRGADECWPWLACRERGYGTMGLHGRNVKAHRFAYELLVGPIPQGLTIDHLCRNRACVNPAHLEPVSMHENLVRRPYGIRCIRGHDLTPENTYTTHEGYRECRTCRRERWAAYSRSYVRLRDRVA